MARSPGTIRVAQVVAPRRSLFARGALAARAPEDRKQYAAFWAVWSRVAPAPPKRMPDRGQRGSQHLHGDLKGTGTQDNDRVVEREQAASAIACVNAKTYWASPERRKNRCRDPLGQWAANLRPRRPQVESLVESMQCRGCAETATRFDPALRPRSQSGSGSAAEPARGSRLARRVVLDRRYRNPFSTARATSARAYRHAAVSQRSQVGSLPMGSNS